MEGCVERTGDDKRAELGDGFDELALRGNFRRSVHTLGLEDMRDIQWMPDLAALTHYPCDARGQRLHRFERRVVRHRG
jgi:hypothetical protein